MKRRILAILLAAIMVLSAVPFSVFAEEATVACPGKGEIHTKDNCESEWFADVAPVCNKPGYSVYTCLNPECGDQFIVITKEASNTPHTLVSATKAPDCNNAGIKENVWQCTACKSYFKDADAKEEYTDKSYVANKLNHTLEGVSQFETLADDCTKEKCKLCGKVQTKSSHKYHEWTLVDFVEAPTCAGTGTAKYVCAIEGCTGKREVTVEASKYMHTLTHVKASTAPACSANGNIEYYSCVTCGKNYATKDANVEDALESTKADHTKGALQSVILGTCTQEGKETYQCTVCFENYDVVTGLKADYIYNVKDAYGNLLKDDDGNVRVFVAAYHKYDIGDKKDVEVDADKYELLSVLGTVEEENKVIVDIYHYYNPQADVYTKETCTTYGYVQRLCVKCGDIRNDQVKNPTGHTIGEDATYTEIITPASCLTAGSGKYICINCNNEVVATIPATGHDIKVFAGPAYGANAVTCVKDGMKFEYCANGCSGHGFTKDPMVTAQLAPGAAVTFPLTGYSVKDGSFGWVKADKSLDSGFHDWNEDSANIINDATCTTAGSKVKYCALCSAHKTEVIPATGHNFELSWNASIPVEDRTLENSDQYLEAIAGGFTATATNKGIVAPTCTEAGYLKLVCLNASCEAKSTDKGSDGETTVSLKVADANGHDDYVKTVLPHCVDLNNATTKKYDKDNKWNDTKGYTVTYCPTCDKELSARTATGATYSLAIEYTLDDAKVAHNIEGVTPTPYINGDCVVKGLDKYICNDCGKGILVVQGNTGAHVQPAGLVITAPTCDAPGKTPEYKCQRCEKTIAEAPIPQLTHKFVKVFNGTNTTCTVQGIKAIWKCDRDCCDKTYFVDVEYNKDGSLKNTWKKLAWPTGTEEESMTLENAKTLDAAKKTDVVNHVAGTVNKKVNPTCLNTGKNPYVVCKSCKQSFVFAKDADLPKKDAKFTTGTLVEDPEDLIIDANGHDYVDYDANKDATCTTVGYIYQECKVCDFGRVIDYKAAIEHDWKAIKDKQGVKATCKVVGGDYYQCANCKEIEIRNRVELLDHVNKDGVAIGNGTSKTPIICTANFKDDQLKCAAKDCGHIVNKTHLKKETIVPATCTADGYKVVTCSGCEKVLGSTVVTDSMVAHIEKATFTEDKEKYVAPTETSAGVKVWICDLCKQSKTERLDPTATVYLDLTYANANGKEGFAEYSLITVNVLLSSKKAAIRTLSYELNYDKTKLEFVSAKFDNTFSIASINDDNGAVKFAGMSPNAVEVGEAAVIATITFRAIAAGTTESFKFANAEAYLEAGAKVEVNKDIDNADTKDVDESKITIATLMDVYTKAGTIDMQDALAIYDLMTNSEYNVAADLDKDGEITANDLQLFYSIFVGTMKKEALRNYEVN